MRVTWHSSHGVRLEGRQGRFGAGLGQGHHTLFSLLQSLLAPTCQLHTPLEVFQGLFKGEFAPLKLFHQGFQLFERVFEIQLFGVHAARQIQDGSFMLPQ